MRIFNIILILFISVNSFSVDRLFVKADSLFQENNIKETISLYQKILDKNLESSELYYNIGICYFQIEEFKKSKSYFQKSLVLNPKSSIVKDRISQCNLKLGKKEPPKLFYIIWWNKLLSLFSKNVSIMISLILILFVLILILLNVFGIKKTKKRYTISLILISLFFHSIVSAKIEKESILSLKDNTESI